ncbi:hypothetical protein [Nitratidesulfovibrio termitidis]|uniref:hypothetical protein n=1 Tax=Nitratidesulfovibrio termitidis TaxID=42252 RepID=UPI00041629CF|nr:hypothetical protein [Nitratidesulfovibrio termitidis]
MIVYTTDENGLYTGKTEIDLPESPALPDVPEGAEDAEIPADAGGPVLPDGMYLDGPPEGIALPARQVWKRIAGGWTTVQRPPTLEEARLDKLGEINAGYESAVKYIQAGYPLEEVLTWERQAAQARELLADPDAPAGFVRGLAAAKGLDVDEMRDRILANAAAWEPISAMLTARRQIMEDAALAAGSLEEMAAVVVTYPV